MISPTYTSEEHDPDKAAQFFHKEIKSCPEWDFIALHVTLSKYKSRIRLEFGPLEWPNGLLTVTGMYVALDVSYLGRENDKCVFTLAYSGIFQKRTAKSTPHPHCYPTSREDAPMCTPKRGRSFSSAATEFLLAGDIASLVSGAKDVVMSINWNDTYRHAEIDLAALRKALRDPNDPACPRCGRESGIRHCSSCGERGCLKCGDISECHECQAPICSPCSIELPGGYMGCSDACYDHAYERMVSCSQCSRYLDPRRCTIERCRECDDIYCAGCSHKLTFCQVHADVSSGLCPECLPGNMTPGFAIDRPRLGVPYDIYAGQRIRITAHNCHGECDSVWRGRFCMFCGYWDSDPGRYVHFDEPLGTGIVCRSCASQFIESSLAYYVQGQDEVDIVTLASVHNLIVAGDVRFPPIAYMEDQYEIRISRHAIRPDDEPVSWIKFPFDQLIESDAEPIF